MLDTFGNLALVSRGVNSEYGNKPYVEKRARFQERNALRAESLKLALIYKNEHWNDVRAGQHHAQMIAEYKPMRLACALSRIGSGVIRLSA